MASTKLIWTNPTEDFQGTMIRFRTDQFPVDETDGTLLYDADAEEFWHFGLSAGTYYYMAFSHDSIPNYASGVPLLITILTHSQLITQPHYKKIQTGEFNLGEILTGSWTQESGNNYRQTYLYEDITLQDNTTSRLTKNVSSMKHDGTSLTSLSTVASVTGASDSFFHDTPNKLLYVNIGQNPEGEEALLTFFTLYIATEGLVLDIDGSTNEKYFEPYLKSNPNLVQSTQNILGGYSQTTVGALKLNNTSGFFDKIIDKFIWKNRTITLKSGGQDVDYPSYTTIMKGVIFTKSWGERDITLKLKSIQANLDRQIPETLFASSAFPSAEDSAFGKVIPIAFGSFVFDNTQGVERGMAPIVTAINVGKSPITTTEVKFKIAVHAILSIDNVYVNFGNETGWATFTEVGTPSGSNEWGTKDLTNATFIVRFATASTYKSGTTKVRVAFQGTKDGSNLMTSTADIVQDLLTTWNDFTINDINTTAFASSEIVSDANMSIYLDKPIRTKKVIDTIAVGDGAYFFVDLNGLFVYRTWQPEIFGNLTKIDSSEIINLKVDFEEDEHFKTLLVGYNFDPMKGEFTYVSKTENIADNVWEIKQQKIVDTYLNNFTDANNLVQRKMLLHRSPTASAKGTVKLQLSEKNIGDKIRLTYDRAPDKSGEGWLNKLLELTAVTRNFDTNQVSFIADDIKGIGVGAGFWMGASEPSFNAATTSEKEVSGFWLDAAGLASPSDPNSGGFSFWY